ncbi:IPT/TIG domain-containing protein [Tieghemostelium lacteum]|uniref:IPT/TIG domain-containing protein n=1 Tax=Tieghemostelium lacteum TaxID=361077 RepID=A0A151ZJH2_TIELA|nr:IPT/TIG domain-containing protein [Tieghemostelium lacteum]|eukprot:KYQ94148.1 IPT/TIG domain-containing protein [Tieghemostelium lacteum]
MTSMLYYLFICILFIAGITKGVKEQSSYNSHYYEYTTSTTPYNSAVTSCINKVFNNKPGYLATITSRDEWDWLFQKYGSSQNYWTSGSDIAETGVWVFNSGPENGQPMYNLYHDKSYTFTGFSGTEPNLLANENYINAKATGTGEPIFNNITPTSSYGVLCEWDFEFYITSTGTQGGDVIISQLGSFDHGTLVVSFKSLSDNSVTNYTQFTEISSTSMGFHVQGGSGKYIVTVSDGLGTTPQTQPWIYNIPSISTIYPNFNSGETITVVGDNFGNDASLLTVTLSTDNIACQNPVFIIPHKAFSCVLASTLAQPLIPITVSAAGNIYKSFKTALFKDYFLYSSFQTSVAYANTQSYSNLLKIDGLDGYLSVIDTQEKYNFIKASIPTGSWKVWQAIVFDSNLPGTSKFRNLVGPNQGQQTQVYSSSALPTGDANDRFAITMSTGVLSTYTSGSDSAAVTQFGGYVPTFIQPNQNYPIPTQGQTLLVKLKNYGVTLSTYEVTLNSQVIPSTQYQIDYIAGGVYVQVPTSAIELNGQEMVIGVTVDGVAVSGGQTYSQAQPTLTSVTSAPTTGGKITLTGTNLYNDATKLDLSFGTKPCTNITYIVPHFQLTCDIPAGTGKLYPVIAQVGTLASAPTPGNTYYYKKPTVNTTTSASTTGGTIYIDGDNFGTDATVISVTVGGEDCENITIVIAESRISCVIQPGQGVKPLVVTVNTQVMTSSVSFSYDIPKITNVTQNNDQVTIVGENFGDNFVSGTVIKVGNSDITSQCTGNNTVIICTQIPLGGQLTISNGGDFSNVTLFYSSPFISSLSNSGCHKAGQSLQISGGYFENIDPSTGTYQALIGQKPFNITKVTNILLTLVVPIGTGASNTLSIQFDDRVSQPVSFAYCAPEVTLITQIEKNLNVKGSGFGDDPSKVTVQFGNSSSPIQPTQVQDTEIGFIIPDNSLNSLMKVTVDGQISNFEQFNIIPVINSVTPPLMNGSRLTISGSYLSPVDANGTLITRTYHYDSTEYGDCQYLSSVAPYTIVCTQPPGTGIFTLKIKDEGQNDIVTKLVSYQAPIVYRSTNSVYKRPTNLTISVISFVPTDVSVYIEDQLCQNPIVVNSETIQCEFDSSVPPKSNGQALTVTVNSGGVNGSAPVLLYILDYDCLNNCSGNGVCNRKSGFCRCDKEWTDTDCSLNIADLVPLPPPTVDVEQVVSQFPGIKLDFNVSITHLRELTHLGKTVKILRVRDIQWVERQDLSDGKYYFKGAFKNDPATLEFHISTFNESGGSVVFAEEEIPMQGNSMKYLITVKNWNFTSQLNSLQVIYTSKTQKESVIDCENANTTTIKPEGETLTWFKIKSGAVSFNARFSNRAIIDSKLYQISVSSLNETDELYLDYQTWISIGSSDDLDENDQSSDEEYYYQLTALQAPHFKESLQLDPNFGALLKSDNSDDCNPSFAKWKIALIVVFGAVAAAIPAGVIFYSRYRYQINYKVDTFTKKLRSLRS